MDIRELVLLHEKREQELKEQINLVKERLYQGIAAWPNISQEDIDYLYWETDLNTDRLAKDLGLYSLSKSASKKYCIMEQCRRCGKGIGTLINSRSELKQFKSSKNKRVSGICESCTQDEKETRKLISEVQKLAKEMWKDMPYDKYLKSEHWQGFRSKALRKANYKCQLCNSGGELHVHHRTYANRGNETYADVIVLCKNCHGKFHDKLDARKEA